MSNESQYLVSFGPDANCTFELCPIEKSVYGYRPSIPANVAFVVLFNTAMIVHVYLGFRWKTWWFMWCLVLGCLHETTGYIGRILLYKNPWSFDAFITQIICITQAPVFYCAAIYVTLGQSIRHYSPALARFPTKYFAWIFVPCDIVSLILQGAGGALSATSSGSSQIGVNIALAGLIFQVITLFVFAGFLGDYLNRFLRSKQASNIRIRDKLFFGFLIFAVVITLIRCIFRADELQDGYDGELIHDEGTFIGLEGVLVVFAVFSLCIAHPGFVFRNQRCEIVVTIEGAGESGTLLDKQRTAYESGHTPSRTPSYVVGQTPAYAVGRTPAEGPDNNTTYDGSYAPSYGDGYTAGTRTSY